jgi:aminopeptidase N
LAHAWCGGLLDISGSDDTWLGEPLTTYLCRTALEQIHAGATPWAPSVSRELPDHAYAGDAATARQLEALIGRQAVLDGLGDLMRHHAHGCATKDDLVESWSRASGRDLHRWAGEVLVPTPRNEGDEDS